MNTIPATQLRMLWETFCSNILLATDFHFLYDVALGVHKVQGHTTRGIETYSNGVDGYVTPWRVIT